MTEWSADFSALSQGRARSADTEERKEYFIPMAGIGSAFCAGALLYSSVSKNIRDEQQIAPPNFIGY